MKSRKPSWACARVVKASTTLTPMLKLTWLEVYGLANGADAVATIGASGLARRLGLSRASVERCRAQLLRLGLLGRRDRGNGRTAGWWPLLPARPQPPRRGPHRDPLPVERAREVSIERVFAACGFELKRQGAEWLTTCAFHDDVHPSLRVNLERGVWHCPVCGVGGDAITFLQQYRRIDFASAVQEVAACR